MSRHPYALLFKTHFWDDFVARRLAAWRACAPHADLFAVVDVSHGDPGVVWDPVIKIRREDAREVGVLTNPWNDLFWYNTDYPLHIFRRRFPGYPGYLSVEYDVVPQIDIDAVVQQALVDGVDLIGRAIGRPDAGWAWTYTCEGVYSRDEPLHKQLLCASLFSNRAAQFLLDRRQEQTRLYQTHRITNWPFAEAFVPTELAKQGFLMRDWAAFGSAAYFRDWPPIEERDLAAHAGEAIIHPVLTGARYVASQLKGRRDLRAAFDPATSLGRLIVRQNLSDALPPLRAAFARQKDFAALRRLIVSGLAASGTAVEGWTNLAKGRPATQSSTSLWSHDPDPALDAAGAVNGIITGRFGFHTESETSPWWAVDLGEIVSPRLILIYNRLDVPSSRAASLVAGMSADGIHWVEIHRNDPAHPFGGADGNPLAIVPSVSGRFLRLQLAQPGYLHLDEVEVFVDRNSPDTLA